MMKYIKSTIIQARKKNHRHKECFYIETALNDEALLQSFLSFLTSDWLPLSEQKIIISLHKGKPN